MAGTKENIGEKIERKLKFIPMKIYLSSGAMKKLIENGYIIESYGKEVEIKVSANDLNKYDAMKNVLVVVYEDEKRGISDEIRLSPLRIGVKIANDSEGIKEAIEMLEKIKEILKNDCARLYISREYYNRESVYNRESNYKCYALLNDKFVGMNNYYAWVNIVGVISDFEKMYNDFILKNGRFPNEDECTEILLKYLSSYDAFEEIDEMLDKLRLRLISK